LSAAVADSAGAAAAKVIAPKVMPPKVVVAASTKVDAAIVEKHFIRWILLQVRKNPT
jgi:hypothetical protein